MRRVWDRGGICRYLDTARVSHERVRHFPHVCNLYLLHRLQYIINIPSIPIVFVLEFTVRFSLFRWTCST